MVNVTLRDFNAANDISDVVVRIHEFACPLEIIAPGPQRELSGNDELKGNQEDVQSMIHNRRNTSVLLLACVCFFVGRCRADENTDAVYRVTEQLVGPEILLDNVDHVRRTAARLNSRDRFEYLASWVLPSWHHRDTRVVGAFPSGNAFLESPVLKSDASPEAGFPVSPVLDLIQAAAECGQTRQLNRRIEELPETELWQRRFRLSMLFMLAHAAGDASAAKHKLDLLTDLIPDSGQYVADGRWPETIAVAYALQQDNPPAGIREFVFQLYAQQVLKSPGRNDPATNLFVARAAAMLDEESDPRQTESDQTDNPFFRWGTASVHTANTMGRGFGPATWSLSRRSVQKKNGP